MKRPVRKVGFYLIRIVIISLFIAEAALLLNNVYKKNTQVNQSLRRDVLTQLVSLDAAIYNGDLVSLQESKAALSDDYSKLARPWLKRQNLQLFTQLQGYLSEIEQNYGLIEARTSINSHVSSLERELGDLMKRTGANGSDEISLNSEDFAWLMDELKRALKDFDKGLQQLELRELVEQRNELVAKAEAYLAIVDEASACAGQCEPKSYMRMRNELARIGQGGEVKRASYPGQEMCQIIIKELE